MIIYRKCDELPARLFFKVIETSDLRYLIRYSILRFFIKKDLSEIWDKLMLEYAELDNNKTALDKFDAYKEMYQLIATYNIINAEIYCLYHKYIPEFINDLSLFGYKVLIKDNCIDAKSLEQCKQMSRSILNDIEQLKNSLEVKEDGKKKNLFEDAFAWLVEGFGNLNDQMSTAQYVALKNRLSKKLQSDGRDKRQ